MKLKNQKENDEYEAESKKIMLKAGLNALAIVSWVIFTGIDIKEFIREVENQRVNTQKTISQEKTARIR